MKRYFVAAIVLAVVLVALGAAPRQGAQQWASGTDTITRSLNARAKTLCIYAETQDIYVQLKPSEAQDDSLIVFANTERCWTDRDIKEFTILRPVATYVSADWQ